MYLCRTMKTAFFNHPRVRQVLTALLLSGALACIFPPATPEFQWWAHQSVAVAIGYVGHGAFFFWLFNYTRLMFVCLGCGAAISFHYHELAEGRPLPQISKRQPDPMEMPAMVPRPRPADLPILLPAHEPPSPSQ